jgi:hypothetical protein
MALQLTVEALAKAAEETPVTGRRNLLQEQRKPLRALFARHPGASNRLALKTGILRCNISDWFLGRNSSPRVEEAILERAAELIANEHRRGAPPEAGTDRSEDSQAA